jgi:kynurenine formamidase
MRTGHLGVFKQDGDKETYLWQGPGLGLDAAEWIRGLDLAAVCSDTTAVEVMPCEDPTLLYPLHLLCIRDMGLPFGEMFDLDELAADCAADGCWEFLLSAPPLKVTGGIGSPVNPLAIK